MKIANMRGRRIRKQRKDVRFALRQITLSQLIEIKSDAVCRPVNWMNKVQWHWQEGAFDRARPTICEHRH